MIVSLKLRQYEQNSYIHAYFTELMYDNLKFISEIQSADTSTLFLYRTTTCRSQSADMLSSDQEYNATNRSIPLPSGKYLEKIVDDDDDMEDDEEDWC